MLEWRRVGKDPTERQVAGDRWAPDEGIGRPRFDDIVLPPITLSDNRRPAKDWATRR